MLRRIFTSLLMLIGLSLPVQADNITQLSDSSGPGNRLDLALDSFSQADYAGALRQFAALAEQYPNHADIQFYFARSLFRDKQLEKAEAVLEKNIARHPAHVESHYVLGSVKLTRVADVSWFRKAGLAKKALGHWQQAHTLDPTHAEVHYGVASFLLAAPGLAGGDKEAGLQSLEQLKMTSPGYAALVEASIEGKNENFVEAEKLFKQAIEAIPGRAFPTLMLANMYVNKKSFEQALSTIDSYNTRPHTWNDPDQAQTALLAGKAWAGLNRNDRARQAYQLVLASNPTDQLKAQALEALEDL